MSTTSFRNEQIDLMRAINSSVFSAALVDVIVTEKGVAPQPTNERMAKLMS
jgi:hypothetical protein